MAKKYLPYIFILASFVFLFTPSLHCQVKPAEKEVLTKVFIENTPTGAMLKAEHEIFDGYQALYFDNRGNIRKYITDFEYPESSSLIMADYNSTGELRSILFRISDSDYSCIGIAYPNTDSADLQLFDYSVTYFSETDGEEQSASGIASSFPDVGDGFRISAYINVNTLAETISLKLADIPANSKKVIFRRPIKNDKAILTCTEIGRKVWIIGVEKDSKSGEIRYKVELSGKHQYMEDFCLEDVEEVVKK